MHCLTKRSLCGLLLFVSMLAASELRTDAPVPENSKVVAMRTMQKSLYTYVDKNTRPAFGFGVILLTIAAHLKSQLPADAPFDMFDALFYAGAGLAASPWLAALLYYALDGACDYLETK